MTRQINRIDSLQKDSHKGELEKPAKNRKWRHGLYDIGNVRREKIIMV